MTAPASTLDPDQLHRIDAYWRAANYLSVGQIYLFDNPLLERPLVVDDVKRMILGHWGTTPGQNFIYAHLNRVIGKYDLDMIYISGPGHGGPAVVANTYLEGTYSEVYPDIGRDRAGLRKLFLQFSFPGGIPSHASPECPGSIHEGGELGYSLSHAFGAVFDNPDFDRRVRDRRRRGGDRTARDGVALEQVPRSDHRRRGAADPASERLQDREPDGARAHPARRARAVPARLRLVAALRRGPRARTHARGDGVDARRGRRRDQARSSVVRASKVTWRDQRLADDRAAVAEGLDRPEVRRRQGGRRDVSRAPGADHRAQNAAGAPRAARGSGCKSYRAEELFDAEGRLREELAALAPRGNRRMGANPHANGGELLHAAAHARLSRDYAIDVPRPGVVGIGDTHVLGRFLRDVARENEASRNFRLFGPDETLSNGLEAVFEVTDRQWLAETLPEDAEMNSSRRAVA